MKRFFTILTSLVLGGIILWANTASGSVEHLCPESQTSHHFVTLLDNPTLNNSPQLKHSMEELYKKCNFIINGSNMRNDFINERNCKNSALSKASEAKSKVECEVIYDPQFYSPYAIYFYNAEFDENFYFEYDKKGNKIPSLTVELPEGEYVAYVYFWIAYDKEGEKAKDGTCALVFKENVLVPCEEKLIFDASEATNQIKYNPILPDGKKPILDLIDRPTMSVLKKGNIETLAAQTFLIDRVFGPLQVIFGVCGYTTKESDEIRNLDIYVNDLSDRFCSYQYTNLSLEETIVAATQYIGEIRGGNTVSENCAEDYIKISRDIYHSPAYEKIGLVKKGFTINSTLSWATQNMCALIGECVTECDYIYFSQDPNCDPETLIPLISLQPYDISFYSEETDWLGNPFLISYNIASLPFAKIDGKLQYVNNNHSLAGNWAFQKPENGPVCEYPGHPRYTFWEDQQSGLIGDNTPINSVLNEPTPLDQDSPNYMNFIYPAFIGRWGEVRNVDNALLSTKIEYDNIEVYNSTAAELDLEQWGAQWGFVDHPLGTFDYYFDNTNITVDGIAGRNYTHVFCDWTKEDKNAPVIQMLMFRNSLDEITDRFDNASDGIVEFSGGDFNYHEEYEPKYKWYFSCEPMDVKLEYSPYNQESWSEIEVMELPEYYFMPGFGYFYRGSLAGVDKMSENGWYDLKFTFTDEVGNYMEQTVSPAFKVASLTGKAEISTSGVQVYANNGMIHVSAEGLASVDVYSMDGRQVSHGIRNDIAINSGVYIVKVSTISGAESVHKVIL